MKCPECKGTGKIELFTSTVDCTECMNGNVPDDDFVVPRSERAQGGYIEPKRNWVPDEEIVFHRGGYPDSAQYDAAPVKICTTKPHGIPIPHGIHPTFIDTLERRAQQYGSAMQSEDRVWRVGQTPRIVDVVLKCFDSPAIERYMELTDKFRRILESERAANQG